MLGPALTFLVLFLQGRHSQAASSCPGALPPDRPVVRRSGSSFCLGPGSTTTAASSFEWKVQLRSDPRPRVLCTWKAKAGGQSVPCGSSDRNHRLRFSSPAPSLLLQAAQPDDSGNYSLEVTSAGGNVSTHSFHVSVLDPVGQPELQLLQQKEAPGGGKCHVTLNCSASGGEVTYTWYRGGAWVPPPRSPFRLEEQIDVRGPHTYTCNASNPVSWASRRLQLGQGCGSAGQEIGLLPLSMIIVVPILTLLGILTCVCVWRRGRKPAEPRPEEPLTVYEDVRNLPIRSGQERRQKRDSPGNGSTVYSMVLPQSSASTSQETATTLYSVVLPTGKVGKIQPRAQHPA